MTIINATYEKNKNYKIELDDGSSFQIISEVWLSSTYSVGDIIEEDDLNDLLSGSLVIKAFNKSLNILSVRSHSKQELRKKLVSNFDDSTITEAIIKLENAGLIDDYAFASDYVSLMLRKKNMSVYRIRQELLGKGIDREIAEEVLGEVEVDPREQIKELLTNKFANKFNDDKGKNRVIASLTRLGFKYEDIRSSMNEFAQEDEFIEE